MSRFVADGCIPATGDGVSLPAPLPPRWIRSARAHRYRHETGDAGAWVSPEGKAMSSLDVAGTLGEVAELVRDLAALLAWLEDVNR